MTQFQIFFIGIVFGIVAIVALTWLRYPGPRVVCEKCGLFFRPKAMRRLIVSGATVKCCRGCALRVMNEPGFQGVFRS